MKDLSRLVLCFSGLLFLMVIGCETPINLEAEIESIQQADRDFSALSEKEGMKVAFLEYAAEDGVLLRPNSMPVVGKGAIVELLEPIDPSMFTLTWEPLFGSVAESGELGYTYGTFQMQIDTLQEEGTYVSIWRKDEAGNWKYVLDTGNDGLGSE